MDFEDAKNDVPQGGPVGEKELEEMVNDILLAGDTDLRKPEHMGMIANALNNYVIKEKLDISNPKHEEQINAHLLELLSVKEDALNVDLTLNVNERGEVSNAQTDKRE